MARSRFAVAIVGAILVHGCGGDSPTRPGPVSAPPVVAVSLNGTVSSQSGTRLAAATLLILDGANAGRTTTTTSTGEYRFADLTPGNANVSASAAGHFEDRRGLTLVPGANTLNFTLQLGAIFAISGQGNQVFDVPAYVRRVRITGSYDGFCENFILRIGGRTIVNEILGACSVASGRTYDGTHQLQTNGGFGETVNSTGIRWTVTELR